MYVCMYRAASMRGVQPSLVRCSICEPCCSRRDTTRWWPFQQAEVRGMSLLEPLGVLTAAPALSRSSATCGDVKERGREGEGKGLKRCAFLLPPHALSQ